MKQINIFIALCCFFALLSGSACRKTVAVSVEPVGFDSVRVDETYYLFNDSSKPNCNLQINFIYPNTYGNASALSQMQHLFTGNAFGEGYDSVPPQIAANLYAKQYIDRFKQFETLYNTSDLNSNDLKDETGFSYYTFVKNKIVYNQQGFVSFYTQTNTYEGGAHGSNNKYGMVIDCNKGKAVTEDMIAGDNYSEHVSNILIDKIAEMNGLKDPKDLEMMGYNSLEYIVPNGNFTIGDKGITYYFNENEIAAYVMGIIEVFIPYEEINLYLRKDCPIASIAGIK